MSPILEIRGLHAHYRTVNVLSDINLDVAQGGVTALLGANGAGKTSLLRAISNFLVTPRGTIKFEGNRIDGKPCASIARMGIAHVPDGRGTFAELSVEENLKVGAITKGTTDDTRKEMQRMYDIFPRLHEYRNKKAGLLSGGEQQMLAIARALMLKPRLLMLDEPSFGLAPLVVRHIFELLAQVNKETRLSILLVEQNAKLALELADTAYVLEVGRIAVGGSAESLRQNPRVQAAYLGTGDH